jgi:tetratricopeptide (TPR) repeat protein
LQQRSQLKEAADAFRRSMEINPKLAASYSNLGNVLQNQGYFDDAIASFRKAIELDPNFAMAYYNLGNALRILGRLEDALDSYRTSRELDPTYALVHVNYGGVLLLLGRSEEAVWSFRRAIETDPGSADGHINLGLVLISQGRFAESTALLQKGIELADAGDLRIPNLRQTLRQMAPLLDSAVRMEKVLKGQAKPINGADCFNMAQISRVYMRRYAQAVRFFVESLDERSDLPRSIKEAGRYDAACAAALAGCGQGEGAPTDAAALAAHRKQARDWLRADLAFQAKRPPSERAEVQKALTVWRESKDLTGVRDADALKRLPEDEWKEWQRFWTEVDDLLRVAMPENCH